MSSQNKIFIKICMAVAKLLLVALAIMAS